jgi:hypothetical protein
MEMVVKLFRAFFMGVNSLKDNKKRNIRYRKAIVLFVSFLQFCLKNEQCLLENVLSGNIVMDFHWKNLT